jgi:hypothetical protein
LSDKVAEIKMSNDLQGSTRTELETLTGAQIETNTGAITTLTHKQKQTQQQ